MTSVEFIYKEIPHSRGSIDKCINITPNEICTMLDKYAASKAENLPIFSVSSRTFFDDIERHFECVGNEGYDKHNHKIEKGRKLWLEIEVENEEMTPWLLKWLYSKMEDGEPQTPFGCKLNAINFSLPTNTELKEKLMELVQQL